MQAKGALQMIGQSSRIQCRPDGSFEEVQCDAEYCWCVNQFGVEMEGTRTSDDIAPNCRAPRKCSVPLCTHDISCKYGMRKDSNGCDTCECSSPCDGVVCPDDSICVPAPVECIAGPCPEVPRCVVNPCRGGAPLTHPSTAQHIKCSDNACHEKLSFQNFKDRIVLLIVANIKTMVEYAARGKMVICLTILTLVEAVYLEVSDSDRKNLNVPWTPIVLR
ncbi:unnamed protein product [Strongylus vulgaris]|uniref:Thyroglobulin type-1 domain-containing protein n=1 Tax=Strongylus vulgaris TaxID=40348 RepID=A0A3P7LLQ5_STRVU|nr:unnamed protein product [Strongylus vulgaris]